MDVQDLEGRTWKVRRQWLPRLEGRGLARVRMAAAARRRKRSGDHEARGHWWDALDFFGGDTLGTLVLGIAAVVLLVLLFLWGLPLLLAIGDLVFVLVLAVIGLVSREVLRRPWTVEAVAGDGTRLTRPVVGYRAAGRACAAWAEELRHGRSQEGGADGSRLLT